MLLFPPRARVVPLLAIALAAPLSAQQLIGYVNARDANVTGASDQMDGHFVLTGSVGVTAKDHTAPITLSRGGTVNVCQTSVLHLTESREMTVAAPLLFSLDRGAVEIQMNAAASDAIMTPDLRFTVRNSGPLDLRLRVSRNGDTCVENRGPGAPTLAVSDPFGEAMYEVPGGRHVLFEHGSLHEVVDRETTACGCPDEKGMSVADAMLNAPIAAPAPKPAPPAPPQPTIVAPPLEQLAAPAAAAPAVMLPAAAPAPAPASAPKPAPPTVPQAVASPPVVIVQPAAQPVVPAPVAKPVAPTPTPAPTPAAAVALPAPVIVQAPAAQVQPPPAPVPVVAAPAASPAEPPAPTEDSVRQAAAIAAARAAALHPFPAAVSEGLAPVPEATPAPAASTHVQISDTLSYMAPADALPAAPVAPAPAVKKSAAKSSSATRKATTGPTQSEPPHDLVHLIGSFFRKLFGRG